MQATLTDIKTTDEIRTLIKAFYARVVKDDLLGPIFNTVIKPEAWPHHVEIMVNFWKSNIFFEKGYNGNPVQVHNRLDAQVNHIISAAHFDRWLALWHQTIDELFAGENATVTKNRAGGMAQLLLFKITESRKTTTT